VIIVIVFVQVEVDWIFEVVFVIVDFDGVIEVYLVIGDVDFIVMVCVCEYEEFVDVIVDWFNKVKGVFNI